MDGFSRWDFVLWIVVAYIAVMVLVRMMLQHRDAVIRKIRSQINAEQRTKNSARSSEKRRDAA